MATSDLMAVIDKAQEGAFKPYACYGSEEDALTFYFKEDADYARRLNSRITIFLSQETNELVGCQIKSIRHVLEDLGWFDVDIQHGKVKLSLLFVACHAEFEEPAARQYYRQIGNRVRETDIELDFRQALDAGMTCT